MMSSVLLRRTLPRATQARAFTTTSARETFAKMTIVGRLADTPELQATSTGSEILKYALATSHGPKDSPKTSWFRVVSFLPQGPQRDFIAGLDKGTLVYVEGEATMNQFEDAEGKVRSSLSIVQQKLDVLAYPKKNEA